MVIPMSKTTLGLDENIEGLLCYLLGAITGVLFLILEKESDFVKFHAMQSILISLSFIIVSMVLVIVGMIVASMVILFPPIIIILGILGPIGVLINLAGLALLIFGMYKAYQGERYKFPIFGDITEDLLKKINI